MAIEAMYPLSVALELIPMPSMGALYNFLNQNKELFPGRYRRSGGRHVSRAGFAQRFLTESEILQIREMTMRCKEETRFARAGRPPRMNSTLASIARRATA